MSFIVFFPSGSNISPMTWLLYFFPPMPLPKLLTSEWIAGMNENSPYSIVLVTHHRRVFFILAEKANECFNHTFFNTIIIVLRTVCSHSTHRRRVFLSSPRGAGWMTNECFNDHTFSTQEFSSSLFIRHIIVFFLTKLKAKQKFKR